VDPLQTSATPDSDSHIDRQIIDYLSGPDSKSFILYAGAGSGKTRSLVNVVNSLRKLNSSSFRFSGRRIGIITYTNAACDEIKHRLQFDPIVEVSTIHSFAWSLISGFNSDIRKWLDSNLKKEISDLLQKQEKGRAGKASEERARSIQSKTKRIENIKSVKTFTYSPNSNNTARDSLNHSEVISITSSFLTSKTALQKILIGKFPILLIDESQDTNKNLMDAFLWVQSQNPKSFSLGLIGDGMQRIYSDGKVDLERSIPSDWVRLKKSMNYRSPGRVISLINKIRSSSDHLVQTGARSDEGLARVFVVSNKAQDKQAIEDAVADRMAEITRDAGWLARTRNFKALILEHHMAARRLGFEKMFEPLYSQRRFQTGLLDGTLPALRFFSKDVLPLVNAKRRGDEFSVAAIVRSRSPLLDRRRLLAKSQNQIELLKSANLAVGSLMKLWVNDGDPTFADVLYAVQQSELFVIPDSLNYFIDQNARAHFNANEVSDGVDRSAEESALHVMLSTPFSQIEVYDQYVSGTSPFGTHQGVKGLEFPRVMVIIDDEEAKGFMFSYDKLFGAKAKTANDIKNEQDGSDTSIDRTRRLFYVTCSRAQESLAIVAYSENPDAVASQVRQEGWFSEAEIERI
jgi:DNA helicase-2/ATP-dependent DNA helicase PcrA